MTRSDPDVTWAPDLPGRTSRPISAAVKTGSQTIDTAERLPETPELNNPTPGTIKNTRALLMSIHVISPVYIRQSGM